jgi:hypothetical protein
MLHAVGLPQKIRKKVIRHELYKSSRVRIVGGILASKRGETQLRNPEYNPTACNIHGSRCRKSDASFVYECARLTRTSDRA